MPNDIRKGVFYHSGKFHISKLSTDLAQFAGSVEGLGLSDGNGAAQSINEAITANSGATSGLAQGAQFPTTQQVVDYVSSNLNSSSDALQEELDKTQISIWGADTDGSGTAHFGGLSNAARSIKSAAADSAHTAYLTFASSTAVAYSGDLANGFSLDSGDSLKAVIEGMRTELQSAFNAVASDADDLQTEINAIETAMGLAEDGTYVAHSAPASRIFAYGDASGMGTSPLDDIDKTDVTTGKQARERLRALIQQNHDNFAVLVNGASVDMNILKEIVDAYQLADTEVVSAITQIVSKTGLTLTNTSWTDYDGSQAPGSQNLPVVEVQELLAASGDSASTNTTKSVGATSGSTSLKAAIEARSNAILVEIAEVQEELDATQSGAGLEASGAYSANTSTQYLGSVATLKAADEALDAEIKTLNERLSDKHGTSESLLDGSFFNGGSGADFALSAGFNVVDALNEIATNSGAGFDALQLEVDRTQANLGVDDSPMAQMAASTNKIYAATTAISFQATDSSVVTGGDSLKAIIEAMRGEADGAFKEVVDAAGFAIDGATGAISYSATASASYVASATTVKDADSKLDAGLVATRDLIDGYWGQTGTADALAGFSKTALAYGTGLTVVDALNELAVMIGSESDGSLALATTAGDLVGAINELHTEMGDNDLDFHIYNGAAQVGGDYQISESETMRFESVAVNLHDNIVLSSTQSGNGVGISIKEEPTFKSMDVDESVSAAVMAYNINVQHEPFVAAEDMVAGDVVCIQKGGQKLFGIEKADAFDADKLEILGLAFDPASTSGAITSHSFVASNDPAVAIVVGQQNVIGVSFAEKDQAGTTLNYEVGDALYLGVDDQGNPSITKAIPVDVAESAPGAGDGFDAKAIISLGFVTALTGENSAAANAMWFEPKLVAMEA